MTDSTADMTPGSVLRKAISFSHRKNNTQRISSLRVESFPKDRKVMKWLWLFFLAPAFMFSSEIFIDFGSKGGSI